MKTLLRIDSSLRYQDSYSRNLGHYFEEEWLKLHPQGRLIRRDVSVPFIPHINQQTINGFYDPTATSELLDLSDQLIDELFRSTDILITAPMYNFGMPSSLKSYFDYIVRTGKTFCGKTAPVGLLSDKRAFAITSMGDKLKKKEALNLVGIHLKEITNYMGITDFHPFLIDGTTDGAYVQKVLIHQKTKITNLLTPIL